MTREEAVAVCEAWFAHNERHRERAAVLQRLAHDARHGQAEAARLMLAKIDRTPQVFDGSRLEPAVRALIAEVERLREQLRLANIDAWNAQVDAGIAATETDCLRPYAERYRWLRKTPMLTARIMNAAGERWEFTGTDEDCGTNLDAAIDAAMAQERT